MVTGREGKEVETLDQRKLQILGAIVEDFVATREPVGSKALLERHDLGVSAATVRNDMSVLEAEGLIHQPHTSAGRVPTDKGYRAFVDHVAAVKPLSAPERAAIHRFLSDSENMEELYARTARLLAQLTHQVAMIKHPASQQAEVRHIELVKVADSLLLVVLITEAGRVDQSTIVLQDPRDAEFYTTLRDQLVRAVGGREVTDTDTHLESLIASWAGPDQEAVREVCTAVQALAASRTRERVVLAGTANLARVREDFTRDVEPLLDMLEEQLVLLRLLSELHPAPGSVEVLIGEEMKDSALAQTSLVGAAYPSGGHLAILGPTRMDYVTGISTVRALARYISRYTG